MPPGAAEFAIGDCLEADGLLLGDHIADQAIFDRAKTRGVDLPRGLGGARLLELGRAQQAPDLVGAKWRFARHADLPPMY